MCVRACVYVRVCMCEREREREREREKEGGFILHLRITKYAE